MNEKFFFEVFHNKYLFKKILEEIETIEWYQYDDYRQYSIYNRRKFKYIKDLVWMVEKRQFELLKCKLVNNEDLNIDETGIVMLFSKCEDQDIIKLFLNKWIDKIKDRYNLYKISIGENNLNIVKLLAEEFKLPLDLDLLKYSIETNRANSVSLVPPYPPSSQEQIKQQQQEELYNIKRDDIISYILNNQLDVITLESFNNSTSPSLSKILNIKSNSLRERLLELNYFEIKRSTFESQCAGVQNIKYSIDLIKFLFKLYFKSQRYDQVPDSTLDEINEIVNSLELNQGEKEIELLLLLVRESESKKLDKLVNDLKVKNGITIDQNYRELNNGSIYSGKDLNELIDTNNNGSNDEKIIEFIFNYTSQKLHKYDIYLIRKAVYLMNSEENYQIAINSIVNSKVKFNLTDPIIKWHPMIKDIMVYSSGDMVIQDNGVIDWIKQDTSKGVHNLKGEYITKRRNDKVYFKNYQIAQYSRDEIEVHIPIMQSFPVKWRLIIDNPVSLTLSKLNIKSLKSKPSLSKLSDQDFISVVNYINQDYINNEFEFKPDLLNYIFKKIIKRYCNQSNTNIQVLNQLRMDSLFDMLGHDSCKLLIDSIVKYNLKTTEFICRNFNLSQATNEFEFEWDNDNFSFFRPTANPLFTPDDICTTRDVTFEQVIGPFKFWLDKTQAALQTEDQSYINVVILVLNHYYKRLIQIQGITFDKVIKARDMVVEVGLDPSLVLRHSLYESFYYLNIKSPKLIKYILSSKRKYQQTLALSVDFQYIKFYDCNFQYDFFEPSTNILHYLDPSIFTLDYLLNSTFDQVLSTLVNLPDEERNMEDELIYYLDIKRFDLFLSEFTKFIQSTQSNKIQSLINSNKFNYSVFYISSIGLIKDYIELVIQFIDNNNNNNQNNNNSSHQSLYLNYLNIIKSTHKYDVYDYFINYFNIPKE